MVQEGNASRPLSRLFLYNTSREMLGVLGDRECTMRETLKCLARYGCVSEDRWPYKYNWVERLPRMQDLEQARQYRSFNYCRLDDYNSDGDRTLQNVLHALADGFPVAFGFSLYSSIDQMGLDAVIPKPSDDSRILGAHAVLAVGYRMSKAKGELSGELLIRNSWGNGWGKNGYGWLPFSYVTRQLACDFWSSYRKVSPQ